MISMVKASKPRDAVEAMLVAQMVSVHVMAMRWPITSQMRKTSLGKTVRARIRPAARTFPAQMEALNRYRNNSEPPSPCRTCRSGDGGNAIVGNVTQHASGDRLGQRASARVTAARWSRFA